MYGFYDGIRDSFLMIIPEGTSDPASNSTMSSIQQSCQYI